MSGKMGRRITGKKPSESQRTSSLTPGAFGRENIAHVRPESEQNIDRAGPGKAPSRRLVTKKSRGQ